MVTCLDEPWLSFANHYHTTNPSNIELLVNLVGISTRKILEHKRTIGKQSPLRPLCGALSIYIAVEKQGIGPRGFSK